MDTKLKMKADILKFFDSRESRLFQNDNVPDHLWIAMNEVKWSVMGVKVEK